MKFVLIDSMHDQGPREYQQDRFYVSDTVLAVADGMGGHDAGDQAAELAIQRVHDFRNEPEVREAFELAYLDVCKLADELHSFFRAPGTTLAVAVLVTDGLLVAHCGDSSVYLNGTRLNRHHQGPDGSLYNCLSSLAYAGIDLETLDVSVGDVVTVASDGMDAVFEDGKIDTDDLAGYARSRGLYDNTTFVRARIA